MSKTNWIGTVKKDLRKTTLTWEEAEAAALDRQEWRRSVAQCIHLDAGWIKVKVKVTVNKSPLLPKQQQLCPFASTRALCSSTSKLLQVPRTNLQFGSCSFCASASTLWNSLPHRIHFCETLSNWQLSRIAVKLFIFRWHSLAPPSNPLPQHLQFNSWLLVLYNFIYLLTYNSYLNYLLTGTYCQVYGTTGISCGQQHS